MDNIEEKFSSHPVGDKKPARRRVAVKKRKATITGEKLESGKIQRIEKELKAIYEDNTGQIPNMRQIQKKGRHPLLRVIFSILFIGGIMSAIAWVGFFYLPSQKQISRENISFEISGPTDLKIGATTTYILRWKNEEKVKISNAVVTANYPDGFAFVECNLEPINSGKSEWQIGSIEPGESGEIKITGQNFGSLNQEKSWRVFLTYKPENFQSELQKTATLATRITESPVMTSVFGPEKAIIGDEVEYVFKVKSLNQWLPDKLILAPALPVNFFIASSTPKLEKNNTWNVVFLTDTSTQGNNELEFKISGKFTQTDDTAEASSSAKIGSIINLPFGTENRLFSIAQSDINTELIKSNIIFSLAINGTMSDFNSRPGDTLNATIHLSNSGKETIKNVTVKIAFDAPALNRQSSLNWAGLKDILDGNIVGEQISEKVRRGTITWTSKQLKNLAELKSGQDVNIDFQLPIKDTANFDMASIGEYLIQAESEASFVNAGGKEDSIGGNPINIILNSDLGLEVRKSASNNTHDVSWILTNNFHPLKDIELSANLFGDTSFALAESAPAGTVNFDEKDKKITWSINEMPESIDVLALPFTVTLKSVNTTQNTLISKVRVRATDTVTGQIIEFMGDEVPIKSE